MRKKKLKKEFCISDIDINKVLLSKEEQFGINGSVKYFIGYGDTDILDFYILDCLYFRLIFPQVIGYAKHFKSN